MTDPEERRSVVEMLAEAFLERYRRGERPALSEYTDQHPHLAHDIRDLFPALIMMEEARPGRHGGAGACHSRLTADGRALERLGDYRIVKEVGRGGMGIVYEAVQEALGRQVALKVLPLEAAASTTCLKRFLCEARSAARLHHTNIVPVFDVGVHDGIHYYAMQFIHGQGLDEVLVELRRRRCGSSAQGARDRHASPRRGAVTDLACSLASGLLSDEFSPRDAASAATPPQPALDALATSLCKPVNGAARPHNEGSCGSSSQDTAPSPVSETHSTLAAQPDYHYFRSIARVVLQVAEALVYAHTQKVLHRDIKPANLLLDMQGTVWVTDFGLAKDEGEDLTRTGDVIGTLRYMAPERFHGISDPRSDLYSLGLTLYELLTLRPAFEESDRAALIRRIAHEEPAPPRKRDRRVPRDLETIVLKAIAREPARRYQSAAALAEDLRRFLTDRPVRARRSSGSEKAWRWCRRNPALAGLIALLVLTFFAGFAAVTWKWREAEKAWTQEQRTRAIADDRGEEIRQGLERLKAANALLDRGRWYAAAHRWDDAHAAFTKALALRPDHASACVERSDLCAQLGLWDLAAEDYAREFALHEPDTVVRWYRHALLCLHLGDVEGYRQLRENMRARFGGTLNLAFATEFVRTSLLAPEAAADSARLLREAEILAAAEPTSLYHRYLLGIAHYRAGNSAAAIVCLRQSLGGDTSIGNLRLMNYPILAMAHHRLRQSAEARQALNEAARTIDQWTQERYQTQGDSWVIDRGATAIWPVAWWDWLECVNYYREAKLLIDGSPPLPDPRLQVLRARSFAGLRWPLQADAEYSAVLPGRPDDPQIRFEAHINRAQSFIHLHQWGRAASQFASAVEVRPDVTSTWCHRAMALLADGDRAGYRLCCASMLQRFHQTENPRTASDVLLACAASSGALGDTTRLLPLTRIAAPGWHLGYHARAGALYRAGKYAETIHCCEAEAQTYRLRAWDWCFLAMAHQRLGHDREARRCLAEAAAWIDQADHEPLDELTGTRPAWGDCNEPVIYRLLFQEAKELVESAA